MAILDGGTVSTTGTTQPPVFDPAQNFNVTVEDVRGLASHVLPNPIAADPHFGEDSMEPTITDLRIQHWINRVSDSVRARVAVLTQYTENTDRWAAITGSARTAVTNGAAAYTVAAAYPTRAGTNDQANYSAELWARYTDELAYLVELPGLFKDQDDSGVVDPGTGYIGVTPRGTRSRSNIPTHLFFHTTATPGTAPGAETRLR